MPLMLAASFAVNKPEMYPVLFTDLKVFRIEHPRPFTEEWKLWHKYHRTAINLPSSICHQFVMLENRAEGSNGSSNVPFFLLAGMILLLCPWHKYNATIMAINFWPPCPWPYLGSLLSRWRSFAPVSLSKKKEFSVNVMRQCSVNWNHDCKPSSTEGDVI